MNEQPVWERHQSMSRKLAWVTVVLTAVNVMVFLVQSVTDNHFYEIGALSYERISGHKEIYRLITCMFLHGGVEHLFGNMLMLYYLGEMLEKAIGSCRYLILYFVAGIGSGFVSLWYERKAHLVIYSVGASGAIYGIIGAMLFLVIVNKGRYESITLRRMLLAIFYMLYFGMKDATVNNAAHIGGLCVGFFTICIMYRINIRIKGR